MIPNLIGLFFAATSWAGGPIDLELLAAKVRTEAFAAAPTPAAIEAIRALDNWVREAILARDAGQRTEATAALDLPAENTLPPALDLLFRATRSGGSAEVRLHAWKATLAAAMALNGVDHPSEWSNRLAELVGLRLQEETDCRRLFAKPAPTETRQ